MLLILLLFWSPALVTLPRGKLTLLRVAPARSHSPGGKDCFGGWTMQIVWRSPDLLMAQWPSLQQLCFVCNPALKPRDAHCVQAMLCIQFPPPAGSLPSCPSLSHPRWDQKLEPASLPLGDAKVAVLVLGKCSAPLFPCLPYLLPQGRHLLFLCAVWSVARDPPPAIWKIVCSLILLGCQ